MSIGKWIVILLGALLLIALVGFGGCYGGVLIGERIDKAGPNAGRGLEGATYTIFLGLAGWAVGLGIGAVLAWKMVKNVRER